MKATPIYSPKKPRLPKQTGLSKGEAVKFTGDRHHHHPCDRHRQSRRLRDRHRQSRHWRDRRRQIRHLRDRRR